MVNYKSRRDKLGEHLQEGDIFVMYSGCSDMIGIIPDGGKGVDPNFYYLTGLYENGLILVMMKYLQRVTEMLLIPNRSKMEAFYMGVSKDVEYYKECTDFDAVDYTANLNSMISMQVFSCGMKRFVTACPNKTMLTHSTQEAELIRKVRNSFPRAQFADLHEEIVKMRHVKDAYEIAAIQKAVDLTGEAIDAVMRQLKPGMTEHQALAIADYTARMQGANGIRESVVATAEHAVILHYDRSDGVFSENDMVMLDLAVDWEHYHSDITRCFPISGHFSERQAYWYQVVQTAQQMTVEKMKPGADLRECGKEARAYMAGELIRAGYITDEAEISLMITQCRKDYVTCSGVNHCIGLETDETEMGSTFTTLDVGAVYTVEPGIYFGSEKLGIRLEDDYLVTEDGVICLSEKIPKNIEEIEAILSRRGEQR